jgi:hypothetical protein
MDRLPALWTEVVSPFGTAWRGCRSNRAELARIPTSGGDWGQLERPAAVSRPREGLSNAIALVSQAVLSFWARPSAGLLIVIG